MMNLGVVLPSPGYLEAVRESTRRRGIVLIFDEVKTGLAIAAGGATERFGVRPDMLTLAKTLGGGVPAGSTPTVLLSPAATSFDMFADYEARGRAFKAAVAELARRRKPE